MTVGDRILFQRHGARQGHWYEGAVHVVRKLEVGVRFNASFGGWSKEQVYNVHFKLNRYPLRRQHQALSTTFTPNRLLFPLEAHIQTRQHPSRTTIRPTVINPLIGQNPPQLQAVTSIVNQKAGSVPFVVFGP
jgi:helicase MOV-10